MNVINNPQPIYVMAPIPINSCTNITVALGNMCIISSIGIYGDIYAIVLLSLEEIALVNYEISRYKNHDFPIYLQLEGPFLWVNHRNVHMGKS